MSEVRCWTAQGLADTAREKLTNMHIILNFLVKRGYARLLTERGKKAYALSEEAKKILLF